MILGEMCSAEFVPDCTSLKLQGCTGDYSCGKSTAGFAAVTYVYGYGRKGSGLFRLDSPYITLFIRHIRCPIVCDRTVIRLVL
jgi:hypothetical protein